VKNLSVIGRIFYGIAITIMGLQAICYADFPYMLIPPKHSGIPGIVVIAYIFGALLMLAGVSIVLNKKIRLFSALLGSILLLIFCFYFIPYQLLANPNYLQFGEWENAAKELALCGGFFVIAHYFSENPPTGFLTKLISLGAIFFAITIISFGCDHLLYINDTADYVPSWVPCHLFWAYFTGIALIGAGIAIVLRIRFGLIATLLGAMIFTWFIILHIPKVIDSPFAYKGSEVTSACLALAYSGIAFVIAGAGKKQ